MRTVFEEKWGELEDCLVPRRQYMERVFDMIEKNDLKAEPLTEVLNFEDKELDLLRPAFDTGGNIKAVRTTTVVPLPRDTEDLRLRLTVLGHAWCFAAIRHSNRSYLEGMGPTTWQRYIRYLLGPHVLKLRATDGAGGLSPAPPWPLVLGYEQAIRAKMVKLVKAGSTMLEGLEKAWLDPVTKDRFFTTPLALAPLANAVKRNQPGGNGDEGNRKKANEQNTQEPGVSAKNKKARARAEAKAKAKAKAKAGARTRYANKTPDGKSVCFRYNNLGQPCQRANCKFEHVCGLCFGDHPMYECTDPMQCVLVAA